MPKKKEIVLIENGNNKVKIDDDGYGDYLFTTRNGYQWSSVPIDVESADMIMQALEHYKFHISNPCNPSQQD